VTVGLNTLVGLEGLLMVFCFGVTVGLNTLVGLEGLLMVFCFGVTVGLPGKPNTLVGLWGG